MNIFKYFSHVQRKEKVSFEVFSRELIKPINDLPNLIDRFYPKHKIQDNEKVYKELVIAFLFSVWHPIEVALSSNPKKNELQDYVHFNAYSVVKNFLRNFNGVEFENTIESRYREYQTILRKQKPNDVFLKLGEAVTYHIDETNVNDISHVVAIGVWIGKSMVENKKSVDKVIKNFDLTNCKKC